MQQHSAECPWSWEPTTRVCPHGRVKPELAPSSNPQGLRQKPDIEVQEGEAEKGGTEKGGRGFVFQAGDASQESGTGSKIPFGTSGRRVGTSAPLRSLLSLEGSLCLSLRLSGGHITSLCPAAPPMGLRGVSQCLSVPRPLLGTHMDALALTTAQAPTPSSPARVTVTVTWAALSGTCLRSSHHHPHIQAEMIRPHSH